MSLLKYYYGNGTSGRVTASPDWTCQPFSGDSVGFEVVERMSSEWFGWGASWTSQWKVGMINEKKKEKWKKKKQYKGLDLNWWLYLGTKNLK